MKKIFYWAPFFSNIATSKAVINSAISLKKYSNNKYEPYLIDVFGEWEKYEHEININKIQMIELNLNKFFLKKNVNGFFLSRWYQIKIFLLGFFPLLTLIKKYKPEILIVHLVTSLPLLLNFFFSIKSQIILRISGLPKLNFLRKIFWKIILKKVFFITAPTIKTQKYLESKFEKKVFLLRDPIISVKTLIKKKRIVEKDYFLSIGRLTKQKNFLFLIRAFKEIVTKDKNIKLYILGEGEQYKKLKKFIDSNNLENNVFLKGYKVEIYDYLKNAKAFILSSLWEDPGFVLIEAAYANTPIISSNCPNGPKEILDNSKNGFLFKSNNLESFFKVFKNFSLSNSNEIYKKKLNAKRMSKNYSIFTHYKRLDEIIK